MVLSIQNMIKISFYILSILMLDCAVNVVLQQFQMLLTCVLAVFEVKWISVKAYKNKQCYSFAKDVKGWFVQYFMYETCWVALPLSEFIFARYNRCKCRACSYGGKLAHFLTHLSCFQLVEFQPACENRNWRHAKIVHMHPLSKIGCIGPWSDF